MRRVLLATTVLCAASAAHAQNLAVSASGFTENGQPVSLRGVDALVPDALAGFANVTADFPGMTMLRLDAQPGTDSAASIAQAVQEYTSKGIVVELEQHSWTGGWRRCRVVFADGQRVQKQSAGASGDNQRAVRIGVECGAAGSC